MLLLQVDPEQPVIMSDATVLKNTWQTPKKIPSDISASRRMTRWSIMVSLRPLHSQTYTQQLLAQLLPSCR